MAAPRRIATYLDKWRLTREYEIVSGVHRYVKAKGTLTLGPHPMNAVHTTPEELKAWTGDGLIGFFWSEPLVKELLARGIAVVNLTQQLAPMPIPVVISDNAQIGRMAAEHLHERGYRRFAYVGLKGAFFSQQRKDGFAAELQSRGNLSLWSEDLADRESLTPEWFGKFCRDADGPIGMMGADDDIAFKILGAAQENGLRVPNDVAIVGVNDIELVCDGASIPLTSIAPAYGRIGFEAASLLDRLLQGQAAEDTVIHVPPTGIIPRMSTRSFAFDDPLVEAALSYMHANLSNSYHVDDVVHHCGKSRRTLEVRFTAAIGHSLHDEINKLRVQRARQLLRDTDWSIAHVAQECGFRDSKHLHDVFLRLEGTPPKMFRDNVS
jgi:LacI family transcriptional regulator